MAASAVAAVPVRLPPAAEKYSAQNETDTRNALVREDGRNVKYDRDNYLKGRIVCQSPDGNWWAMSVSNAGATVWTLL